MLSEREVPEMPEETGSIPMERSFDSRQLEETLERILTTKMLETMGKIETQNGAVLDIAFNIGKLVSERLLQLLLPLLATLGGFFLWNSTLNHPDIQQLIGLGLYGAFVMLPVLYTFRRK
jgi:hypothetical protein